MDITSTIYKLRNFWLEEHGLTPEQINQGDCMNFADDLLAECFNNQEDWSPRYDQNNHLTLPKTAILSDAYFCDSMGDGYDPTEFLRPEDVGSPQPKGFNAINDLLCCHYWVYHNGKHYDSETPEGVENMFDLPCLKGYVKKVLKKAEEENKDFEEWLNSDNVVKTGEDEYRTQDSLYRIPMTLEKLKAYFKKEFRS